MKTGHIVAIACAIFIFGIIIGKGDEDEDKVGIFFAGVAIIFGLIHASL